MFHNIPQNACFRIGHLPNSLFYFAMLAMMFAQSSLNAHSGHPDRGHVTAPVAGHPELRTGDYVVWRKPAVTTLGAEIDFSDKPADARLMFYGGGGGGFQDFDYINFAIPEAQLAGTEGNPRIITNFGGQAMFQMMHFKGSNASYFRLTGEYKEDESGNHVSGDPNYLGFEGFYSDPEPKVLSDRFGIWVQNRFNASRSYGIRMEFGNFHNFQIDNVEISDCGFAGMQIKHAAKYNTKNMILRDLYIHDVEGEGLYFGDTGQNKETHTKFENMLVENIIIARAGAETAQTGQMIGSCHVSNNVFWGDLDWRDAFQDAQDSGAQFAAVGGDNYFENNILLSGPNKAIHIRKERGTVVDPALYSPQPTDYSPSGTQFINNNLFFGFMGIGTYVQNGGSVEGDTVMFSNNYWVGQRWHDYKDGLRIDMNRVDHWNGRKNLFFFNTIYWFEQGRFPDARASNETFGPSIYDRDSIPGGGYDFSMTRNTPGGFLVAPTYEGTEPPEPIFSNVLGHSQVVGPAGEGVSITANRARWFEFGDKIFGDLTPGYDAPFFVTGDTGAGNLEYALEYQHGDVVRVGYPGTGYRYYVCIQSHNPTHRDDTMVHPPNLSDPDQQNEYWKLIRWSTGSGFSYYPPDDFRLVEGSLYQTKDMGILVGGVIADPLAVISSVPTFSDHDEDGEIVTLDASSSRPRNNGTITDYAWSWENVADPGDTGSASGVNPTITLNIGTYAFTLVVTDNDSSTGSATALVTVIPNRPPVAVADGYSTRVNTDLVVAVAQGVLDNDSDVNRDTLSVSIQSNPSNGSLVLNSNGSFTYTPDTDYEGTDSFVYIASDGVFTDTGTVTVTVSPDTDILLHLPFDEGSGTIAFDVGGNGLQAALELGSAFNSGGHGGSGSVTFDGASTSVNAGNINIPGNEVTLACWFYADDFGTPDGRLISKASGSGTADHIFMLSTVDSGGQNKIRARLKTEGVTPATYIADDSISAGAWYHAAVVYDGETLTFYINGSASGSSGLTGNVMTSSDNVAIGSQPGGGNHFDGKIDDVRIYKRALSPAEISEIYDYEVAPKALADSYEVASGVPLSVDADSGVLANDMHPESAVLRSVLVGGVSNGSLSFGPSGAFTYTPEAGFSGTDTFLYYTVDDWHVDGPTTVTFDVTSDDADGDGLPDTWENTHFGGSGSYDDTDDPDADQIPNWMEYAVNSDPNDSVASAFVMTEIEVSEEPYLKIDYEQLKGASGYTYQLEYSTNLEAWSSAAGAFVDMGTTSGAGDYDTASFRLSEPLSTHSKQFVRLRVSK
ncbi:MAG: cadherin-like domain-containing protein [Verrucomicrobiae bacterium]|nr:cadherin-like domain-containing protein [Verrucomicrobiae bacterium]